MFPNIHDLTLLLPVLLSAALFLIVVVVFVSILVVLLRKLHKLQEVQASQTQAVRQQQTAFTNPPSTHVPSQALYMRAQPVLTQNPVLSVQEPAASVRRPPIPLIPPMLVQGVQVVTPQNDLLDNHPWLSLVEDNIAIYDELDRHMESFDEQRKQLAEHVLLRLEEILERSGVSLIQGETSFDRHRHQPVPASTSVAPGAPILETLRPGFSVDGRILRRAHVRA